MARAGEFRSRASFGSSTVGETKPSASVCWIAQPGPSQNCLTIVEITCKVAGMRVMRSMVSNAHHFVPITGVLRLPTSFGVSWGQSRA